ncbi:MAG: M20/M25/M40 family metallo-hydrolase [Clostridium sp.]|uniref:M20/M25/M40 family metallo-hydrolase n=1 Tax=Clostridium sp. TaxID=1506 RepID=UPI003F380E58
MKSIGLDVIKDDAYKLVNGTTDNIIAKLKSDTKEEPMLFSCHMDPVGNGKNIKPIIKKDVVYSDGTTILGADDKAGIAAIIEAILHIKEENLSHPTIKPIFTICEEIRVYGSKNLNYSLIESKRGFVLDSGDEVGTIINKGPAQDKRDVVITGKAAHASVAPENGISSINVASKAISKMNLF